MVSYVLLIPLSSTRDRQWLFFQEGEKEREGERVSRQRRTFRKEYSLQTKFSSFLFLRYLHSCLVSCIGLEFPGKMKDVFGIVVFSVEADCTDDSDHEGA